MIQIRENVSSNYCVLFNEMNKSLIWKFCPLEVNTSTFHYELQMKLLHLNWYCFTNSPWQPPTILLYFSCNHEIGHLCEKCPGLPVGHSSIDLMIPVKDFQAFLFEKQTVPPPRFFWVSIRLMSPEKSDCKIDQSSCDMLPCEVTPEIS